MGPERPLLPARGCAGLPKDLPNAKLHLLETGHFATATHSEEIAELVAAFLD
jgi:NADPH:quinone reductase